jgi:leucyl-tRNA synthetase
VGAAQAQNQAEMITLAKKDDKIASWLTNKKVVNTIFVPGKLINFVID